MMFWIYVAVLLVIALIIVVIPLLKVEEIQEVSREDQNIIIAKDKLTELKKQLENDEITQDQFTIAKEELENSLALDLENQNSEQLNHGGKWLIILLVIAIPLSSVGLYQKYGKPDLLDPQAKLAELRLQNEKQNQNIENMSVKEILALVKKRLADNPEDAEGWYILGRTFMNLQQFPQAVTAYQRAYDLIGEDPNIMLSLADALAMTKEGAMAGEPEDLVTRALAINPDNEIGLWLAGLSAEQRNDIPTAYGHWSRLLPLLRKDPASYNEIKVMLAQLKVTFPDLPAIPGEESNVVDGVIVKVSISIDESIKAKLNGNEQVFVYAKAVTGPPMPLAAKKYSVAELPITTTLSNADAMMPQLSISTVDAFTVGARVSMSGNPISQKGDYFVEVSPLDKNSELNDIQLVIKKIVE